MIIALVPTEYVHEEWQLVGHFIEEAIAQLPGRMTGGDVYLQLASGAKALWIIAKEDGERTAALITSVADLPLCRILTVDWLGGRGMRSWLGELLVILNSYAKDMNCQKIECHGRKGWVRALKNDGWKEISVSLERDVR